MPEKKPKIVFIVTVLAVAKNGLDFEVIAKNVEIREPVWYKDSVIKKALLKQHPELETKLKGRGWTVEIVEWL